MVFNCAYKIFYVPFTVLMYFDSSFEETNSMINETSSEQFFTRQHPKDFSTVTAVRI